MKLDISNDSPQGWKTLIDRDHQRVTGISRVRLDIAANKNCSVLLNYFTTDQHGGFLRGENFSRLTVAEFDLSLVCPSVDIA
jgi:hypothetical protein